MPVRLTKRDSAIAKFWTDRGFRRLVVSEAKKNNVAVGINPDNLVALLKILAELLPYILKLFV